MIQQDGTQPGLHIEKTPGRRCRDSRTGQECQSDHHLHYLDPIYDVVITCNAGSV